MISYSVLSRSEYFSEIAGKIDGVKTNSRVIVVTMGFEPWEPAVGKIINSLNKAATRGVKTNLIVDAYCFMAGASTFTPGPLFWHKKLPKHMGRNHSNQLSTLIKLKQSGGNYIVTNWPSRRLTPPFKGRSHIKFAVINNYVYVGNCNLDNADQIDLMVGWEDEKSAHKLYDFAENIIKTESIQDAIGSKKDLEIILAPHSRLILDVGQPDQSLIFNETLKLIDSAQESIVYTCQFFPDKLILNHLVTAHKRGVAIKLIYNHPLNRKPLPGAVHYLNTLLSRLTLPGFLFKYQLPRKSKYLHAKLLIIDQKTTIIGSHNLVEAGVKFGTAELALISTDPLFAKQAKQVITKLLS